MIAFLFGGGSANAQTTYYWDNNGSTAGFGTASGTWAATTTGDSTQGWSTSSAGTLVPSNVTTSTSDAVNFGTSSAGLATGTITLSGSASAGNLTFGSASGAITLSGSLRLASSGTIDVNNSAATITGIIAGAGTSLTKTGTGTLVLGSTTFTSAASNYAGATYVLGGTLQLLTGNNTYTLKAGNTVYLGDTTGSGNTTLQIGNQGAKSLFSGNIVVQSGNTGTSTIFVNPFNADTSGLPHLTGTITLGSANQAGHDVTIRGTSPQGITLSPVIQDASGATSFATVTFTGSGQTLLYFGNSTYQGATVISPNTILSIGGASSSLATSSAGSTTSGRLGSGPITNNGQLNFNRTDAYGGAYANAISGTGSLTLNTGTLTLSGSNTYAGTTTLSGSTGVRLNLTSTNAIGTGTFTINGGSLDNSTAAALTLATNNPQNWNGDFTFVGTNPLNLGTGAVTLGATRQVTVTSSTLTVGGAIAGSSLGLTKAGNGTLVVTGSNTFTGTTSVNAGTLQVGAGSTSGRLSPSSAITGSAGATLAFFRANTVASGTDFAATIGGAINISQIGSGTLVLGGSNGYTGSTSITGGQLRIDSGGSINGTSGITINGASAEFKYNSATALTQPITFTAGTLSGTGSIGTAVTVGTSDFLSPGNSPGIQAYTSGLTWASGGTYVWEINNWGATAGTDFDQVQVSGGNLTVSASTATPFTIQITGLTGGNAVGVVPGFSSGNVGRSFVIATGTPSGMTATNVVIDSTTAFTPSNPLPTGAGFWLSQTGSSVILNYAPSARYTLTGSASATAIRTGSSTTLTATITSGTSVVTNPDSLAYAGLALSGGAGSLSSTSGTLAGGGSGSGSVSFSTNTAASYTFTPSITSGTNVNLGTTAIATSTTGVTVSVYNPAAASLTSGTSFSLGNVRVSGTFGTQTLGVWNTATAATGFQEGLAATISGTTGQATGGVSVAPDLITGTNTFTFGLGGNANTSTAGVKSGTVTLGFTSTGTTSTGATGLNPLALGNQTVAITGTAYDWARAAYSGTAINFGIVHRGASVSSQNVAFTNPTVTNAAFQDSLTVSASTGNTLVTGNGFSTLAAGSGTGNLAISIDTSSAGSLASTLSLTLTSNANGVTGLSDGTAVTVGGGSITTTGGVFSGTGSWNVNGGGSWGTGSSSNWTSAESVAAAPGTFGGSFTNTDSATFGSAVSSGTATVSLNGAAVSLASLAFNNTSARYVIATGTGSGSLTLASASGTPSVDVVGTHEIAAGILGTSGLSKTGLGTLVLSGSNGYSGATTISAGVISFANKNAFSATSGISIGNAAGLTYTGAADTFSKNITVTSGTGTVTNSGSQTLTLGGTLTKNGTVLRLTGGAFNVTGQITGTSAKSDLYVDGATVTLSNTNSYNGPTVVYNGGTLVLGTNSAIPSNSVVTLGGPGTGTLDLGGFTNTIGGLLFSGSGGTLKMAANQTVSAQLVTSSSLALGAGTALDLTGMGTTAGLYRLMSYTSQTGTFATVTGLANGYQLVYGSTALDAQQQAVLGAVTVANPAVSIITGGSAAFTYTVANANASNGASLSFTGTGLTGVAGSSSGSASAAGTSTSISGLVFTGTSVGNNQQGTFTVSAPTAYGATSTTGTVSVNVLDHSHAVLSLAGGSGQTIITGGAFGAVTFNLTNAGSNRAAVQVSGLVNLTGSTGGAVVASGGTASYTGTGLNNTLIGTNNLVVSATAGDQNLSGANPLTTLSATATYTVLDHSNAALALASGGGQTIITGGSLGSVTFNLTNSGSNLSALDVNTLSNLSGTTGSAVVASNGSATYTASGFDTSAVGQNKTLTVSLSAGDQQTLSGASALASYSGTATYTVLDHSNAALALASGGGQTIITGGSLGSVTFNLTNSGSNLSALDVNTLSNLSGTTGSAVVASNGSVSYTYSGATSSSFGSNTLSVSLKAGDQQSLSGASALQTLSGSTTYTVLDHSNAAFSLAGGNNQTIITGGSLGSVTFNLTNAGTGRSALDVSTLSNLSGTTGSAVVASNGSATYTASGFDTSAVGQNKTLTVSLSAGDQQTLSGASALASYSGTATYTVLDHSNAALALASGGGQTIITGGSFASVGFNLTNAGSDRSAVQVNSLTNLVGGTGTAVVLSGGTGSYAASILDTTTIGTGTLSVGMLAGDQQSLSGASALQSLTSSATYTVLDHSLPGFLASGITNAYAQDVLNIDFGSVDESAGQQSFTYNLLNLASQTYGAGLTAGLDFTGVTADGDGFASGLSTFNNLVGGGTSSLFTFTFNPSGQGTFSKTFTLSFHDNRNLSGAASRRDLTITANVIVVPEPGAIALASIGVAAAAWALRRRK